MPISQSSSPTSEMHPLFPSGEWEGFFSYYIGDKHVMHCFYSFHQGVVTGTGSDEIGPFTWKGTYSTEALNCSMTKFYSTHTVFYKGEVDENGWWGYWEMNGGRGGFHLWPTKTKGENHQAQQMEIEALPNKYSIEPKKIEINL